MNSKPTQSRVKSDSAHVLSLKKIKSKPVTWLWDDRLASDCLTLVDGHPGTGKSTLAASVAAHVTGGPRLPDMNENAAGTVSWFTREEGYSTSVVPRLLAAGTKIAKVLIPTDSADSNSPALWRFPSAWGLYDKWVKDHRIKLLVFDPITSFLDEGTSLRDDSAIRAALEPLSAICRERHCAALLLRHFRKGNSGTAGEQGAGSYAFAAVCRTQIGCYSDPDTPTHKSVAWIKSNLGPLPTTLVMKIEVRDRAARAVWVGTSARSAEVLAEGGGDAAERSAGSDADALLKAELQDGRKPAVELKKIADALGISPKQLRRAKERLRVSSENVFEDGVRKWFWVRPKNWPDA